LADTVDLSLARINGEFGQFLGTNLFLYEEGQLQRPAQLRFNLPAGWQMTTALAGSGTGPYNASDYHELVDAETFVGKYSLDSVQVDGKWIRIAVWPADAYTPAVARNMRSDVERIAKTENGLTGDRRTTTTQCSSTSSGSRSTSAAGWSTARRSSTSCR